MKQMLRQLMSAVTLTALISLGGPASAQENPAPVYSQEQLEQMVAPVALYPDSLLIQVFMAATYPLEVVTAARWSKEHPNITGKALDEALQKEQWDPSVKSLAAIPQVLAMMDAKLEWTQDLGNAFLAQQKDLMDAVQRLRAKAQAQGALITTKEQKVKVVKTSSAPQTIVIEQVSPDVVYVPVYNPTVVYGAWSYPASPPVSWYPPGYVASNVLSFGLGVAAGAALWGDYDWDHHDVNINVNHYETFNHVSVPDHWHDTGHWEHDPVHRRGVPYNNIQVENNFRVGNNSLSLDQKRVSAREDFRGRTDNDHGTLSPVSRPGQDGHGQRQQLGQRQQPGQDGHGQRQQLGQRQQPGQDGHGQRQQPGQDGHGQRQQLGQRQQPGQSRQPGVQRSGGNAFSNVDRGGLANRDKQRGAESRAAMRNR